MGVFCAFPSHIDQAVLKSSPVLAHRQDTAAFERVQPAIPRRCQLSGIAWKQRSAIHPNPRFHRLLDRAQPNHLAGVHYGEFRLCNMAILPDKVKRLLLVDSQKSISKAGLFAKADFPDIKISNLQSHLNPSSASN